VQLKRLWDELFPAEQARIVQLLVERVDVRIHGRRGSDAAKWAGRAGAGGGGQQEGNRNQTLSADPKMGCPKAGNSSLLREG
jgi:hypothetical protein